MNSTVALSLSAVLLSIFTARFFSEANVIRLQSHDSRSQATDPVARNSLAIAKHLVIAPVHSAAKSQVKASNHRGSSAIKVSGKTNQRRGNGKSGNSARAQLITKPAATYPPGAGVTRHATSVPPPAQGTGQFTTRTIAPGTTAKRTCPPGTIDIVGNGYFCPSIPPTSASQPTAMTTRKMCPFGSIDLLGDGTECGTTSRPTGGTIWTTTGV